MIEVVGNLHMHTPYSDGALYHAELAQVALEAGLDFICVTDHNVYVQGVERYHASADGRRSLLLLVSEEIHDQIREPQKNHMLTFGIDRELSTLAQDPQRLLEAVRASGGFAFLAHPYEQAAPVIGEDDLGWVDWQVSGYAGIELWNYMSEFKSLLHNLPSMLFYAFNPERGIRGPFPQTLALWDDLLARGQHVAVLGGSDAHGQTYSAGPLRRVVFPYAYLFRAVNTHLLLEQPLSADFARDRAAVLDALRLGRGWVGYDLPAPTRHFRLWAEADGRTLQMGEAGRLPKGGAQILASLPLAAHVKLVRAGEGVVWEGMSDRVDYRATLRGAYRLEAWRRFHGRDRGWIFSNPIYLTEQ